MARIGIPRRVLDLTDLQGFLCGRILADLGFDVVKIERPGGDASRRTPPLYRDRSGNDESLYWLAYNLNKRGITLDMEKKEGQALFRRLVATSGFVIESFPVGYLDSLSLGYADLLKVNDRLIMTSITPFGQDGPYASYKSSDLVSMAMGGLMNLIGDPDRPPVRVTLPQSYVIAGAAAAMATMAAHHFRETRGEGQHVDVSIQASVATVIASYIPLYELSNVNVQRMGSVLAGRASKLRQRTLWPCRDGYVAFFIMAGPIGKKTNQAFVDWMESEQVAPEHLKKMDWDTFDMATATQELQDRLEAPIGDFCRTHTKAEILAEALKRGMNVLPVSEPADVLASAQLEARDFWLEVDAPDETTTLTFPGFFAKFSETPCTLRRRPPRKGEHNEEICMGELGLTKQEVEALREGKII